MKLILNCHTDNEFSEGMDYAFLELTTGMASLILRRKASFEALQQNDRDLSEIHYDDIGPVYFSSTGHVIPEDKEDWFDTLTDIADGEDFKEVADLAAEDLENYADRSECDRMVISNDSVWFQCYQKHCDWHTETHPIDYETVRQATR